MQRAGGVRKPFVAFNWKNREKTGWTGNPLEPEKPWFDRNFVFNMKAVFFFLEGLGRFISLDLSLSNPNWRRGRDAAWRRGLRRLGHWRWWGWLAKEKRRRVYRERGRRFGTLGFVRGWVRGWGSWGWGAAWIVKGEEDLREKECRARTWCRDGGGESKKWGRPEAENWRRRRSRENEEERRLCFNYCFVFHFGVDWRNFYFFRSLWSVWCYLAKLSLFIINFYINYIFSLF